MNKETMKNQTTKEMRIILFALSMFVLCALIYNTISTLYIPYTKISGPSGTSISRGTVPGIAQKYVFWGVWGKASIPFYFTIQSNAFVFFYLLLRSFNLVDPRNSKHGKRFQIITLTNITTTFLVYWCILAPIDVIWHTPLKIMDTINIHLISFIIAMTVFLNETLRINGKNQDNIKLPKKEFMYALIYPVIWLIVAIILYYSTRTEVLLTLHYSDGSIGEFPYMSGIAIYPFIAFDVAPLWLPLVSIFVIAILISLVSFTFVIISNKTWKRNKNKTMPK